MEDHNKEAIINNDLPISHSFIFKALHPVPDELAEIKCDVCQIGIRVEALKTTQKEIITFTKALSDNTSTSQQIILENCSS